MSDDDETSHVQHLFELPDDEGFAPPVPSNKGEGIASGMGARDILLGVVFVLAAGTGVALTVSANDAAEFWGARISYLVAAAALVGWFVLWLREGRRSKLASWGVGVFIALIVMVGAPALLLWVNHREALTRPIPAPAKPSSGNAPAAPSAAPPSPFAPVADGANRPKAPAPKAKAPQITGARPHATSPTTGRDTYNNNGVNNGIVGPVTIGPQPFHLTDAEIAKVLSQLPDRASVNLNIFGGSDAQEMGDKLQAALESNGHATHPFRGGSANIAGLPDVPIYVRPRPDMYQQYGPGMASYQPTFAGTLGECLQFMQEEFFVEQTPTKGVVTLDDIARMQS